MLSCFWFSCFIQGSDCFLQLPSSRTKWYLPVILSFVSNAMICFLQLLLSFRINEMLSVILSFALYQRYAWSILDNRLPKQYRTVFNPCVITVHAPLHISWNRLCCRHLRFSFGACRFYIEKDDTSCNKLDMICCHTPQYHDTTCFCSSKQNSKYQDKCPFCPSGIPGKRC